MKYYGFYDLSEELIAVLQRPDHSIEGFNNIKNTLNNEGLIEREISFEEYNKFDELI